MRSSLLPPLLRVAPVAIATVDLAGRIQDANEALLSQAGYTIEDLRGRSFVEFLAPGSAPDVGGRFRELARGEVESYRTLRRFRTGYGAFIDVELRVSLVRTPEGRPDRCIAVLQDVTRYQDAAREAARRREIEEALRLSEVRYRTLVEQSPLSIQILSPDGRTLQVNGAWERLWGIRFEQLGDYNMLADPQLVERGLMPYIERGFAGESVAVPAARYDPEETLPGRSTHPEPARWVRAVMYPLKAADGTVREVVLIHEDITAQVRADEQRRRIEDERERLLAEARSARSEAEAALRVKEEFLAVLSHELRTPLNAVLGWARILRARGTSDEVAHAVSVIERNALEQARLIDEMLDLSRITTGTIRLRLEPVDVQAVAAAAMESLRPAAEARRILLELHPGGPLPHVQADRQRIQQVFWNLLANAVKFTEPGGRVTIALAASADALHAEVADTGIGIAPEILPFVFDRFRQGDSSSTRPHSGLGLGLAIVRHLIELHGGRVEASSAGPGTGATFRLTLPLRS